VGIEVIHYFSNGIVLQGIQSYLINIFIFDQVKRFLQRGLFIPVKEALPTCFLVKPEAEKHSGNHYQGED